jgi:hypothetical protein
MCLLQTIASVPGHPLMRLTLQSFVERAASMQIVEGMLPDTLTGPGERVHFSAAHNWGKAGGEARATCKAHTFDATDAVQAFGPK